MIIADENIAHSLIAALRESSIEVLSIYEVARGITDAEIVAMSQNPPRTILTEDKDFANIVFAYETKSVSVILLKYHYQDLLLITNILMEFFKK